MYVIFPQNNITWEIRDGGSVEAEGEWYYFCNNTERSMCPNHITHGPFHQLFSSALKYAHNMDRNDNVE